VTGRAGRSTLDLQKVEFAVTLSVVELGDTGKGGDVKTMTRFRWSWCHISVGSPASEWEGSMFEVGCGEEGKREGGGGNMTVFPLPLPLPILGSLPGPCSDVDGGLDGVRGLARIVGCTVHRKGGGGGNSIHCEGFACNTGPKKSSDQGEQEALSQLRLLVSHQKATRQQNHVCTRILIRGVATIKHWMDTSVPLPCDAGGGGGVQLRCICLASFCLPLPSPDHFHSSSLTPLPALCSCHDQVWCTDRENGMFTEGEVPGVLGCVWSGGMAPPRWGWGGGGGPAAP